MICVKNLSELRSTVLLDIGLSFFESRCDLLYKTYGQHLKLVFGGLSSYLISSLTEAAISDHNRSKQQF